MRIDVKEIQGFTWKIVRFSMKTCCRFAQTYPAVSGVLLFSFALYIFLPSVFYFLLYSSPFLACTAAFLRFYLKTRQSHIDHVSKKEREARAMSRRTRKGKIGELEKQEVKKEKEMVSLIAGIVTSLDEDKPDITMKERGSGSVYDGGSCSRDVSIGESISALDQEGSKSDTAPQPPNKRAAKFSVGSEAELDSESSEDEEVTSAGEAQENLHEAVEWNKDDQKNLMDLGISEIERNRRLESLTARRRARKMYKLQGGKNLIDLDNAPSGPGGLIAPIMVARNNPFTDPPEEHIPGSAPSILLPGRNPFDIPYDPSEEKPNLMADSFQQEFMPPNQREMIFTRHESFFLGPSYPIEHFVDQPEGYLYSRIRTSFDKRDHDQQDDHSSPQGGKPLARTVSITDLITEEGESSMLEADKTEQDTETANSRIQEKSEIENARDEESTVGNASEAQSKMDAMEDNKIESIPSSPSLEDKEQNTSNSSENKQPAGFKFPPVLHPAPNSLPCPIPKCRAVNVNEPSYEPSPSANDNPKMEDQLYYQTQGPWHTPSHSIASDMQVEVSEIGSPPLTMDGSHSSSDGESLTYDGDIDRDAASSGGEELWGASPHCPRVDELESRWIAEANQIEEDVMRGVSRFRKETDDLPNSPAASLRADLPQEDQISSDVKPMTDGVREQIPSNSSDTIPPENDATAHTQYEEPLNPFETPAEETNMSYTVDNPSHLSYGVEESKSSQKRDGGAEKSVTQEISGDMSQKNEARDSKSNEHNETKSLNSPEKHAEEVKISYKGDDPIVHINDKHFIPDHEEKRTTEVGVSGLNQCYNDPSTSSTRPLVSQASISIPAVSPKSVLTGDIPTDDPPLPSDLRQQILVHVSESEMRENKARDALLDEQYPPASVPNTPQNAKLVVEATDPPPFIASTPEKSEEPSKKANEMSNMIEPVLSDEEAKEDLKSTRVVLGESGSLTINESTATGVAELSKPSEEINLESTKEEDSTNTNLARTSTEEAYAISPPGGPSMNDMANEVSLRSFEDKREGEIIMEPLNPYSKTLSNCLDIVAGQFNGNEAVGVASWTISTEDNGNNATANEDREELRNLSHQREIVDLIKSEDDDDDDEYKIETTTKDNHKVSQELSDNPRQPAVESHHLDISVPGDGGKELLHKHLQENFMDSSQSVNK